MLVINLHIYYRIHVFYIILLYMIFWKNNTIYLVICKLFECAFGFMLNFVYCEFLKTSFHIL